MPDTENTYNVTTSEGHVIVVKGQNVWTDGGELRITSRIDNIRTLFANGKWNNVILDEQTAVPAGKATP